MPIETQGHAPALAAALKYLSYGWSVLPLRARDKRPLIRWEALQKAQSTASEVEVWFRQWPDANLGIVTGKVSGLIVLDVDPKHGGNDTLQRIEQRFGALPVTVAATTGAEGQHYYFKHPGYEVRDRSGLGQGIDVRGDGGYVVAPPSMHPSGQAYRWLADRSPADRALASLPDWLLMAAGIPYGRSAEDWAQLALKAVPQEDASDAIAGLSAHLLWHGVDPRIVLSLLLAWNQSRCRPPLAEDEVEELVRNIARLYEIDPAEQLGMLQQLT
jgi:hypothetical protein